jgi:hypothetical protein
MGFEVLTAVAMKITVVQDVKAWYMIMNVSKGTCSCHLLS